MLLNAGIVAASVTGIIEDPDAAAYLDAVEVADGQTLEPAVRAAVNAFVVGCKDDGIWNAIKASCILAGARTRTGAMVPLKGTAPTSFNFVDADYNRKEGLKGDGSSKWLNTNRLQTEAGRDNQHCSVWISTTAVTGNVDVIGVGGNTVLAFGFGYSSSSNAFLARAGGNGYTLAGSVTGTNRFIGLNKSSTTVNAQYNFQSYNFGQNTTNNIAQPFVVFAYRNTSGVLSRYTNALISFY